MSARFRIALAAAILLLAGALALGWLRGRDGSGSLPVPGESPASPREEITDAEKQRLREILEKRRPDP